MPAASWTTIAQKRHTLTRHPDVLEAYQDFKLRLAAQGLHWRIMCALRFWLEREVPC